MSKIEFSKLNVTNSVIYYDLNTIINIFEIFDLLEINEFVLGMKIREFVKGNMKGKAFKNALHVKLKGISNVVNCKIFSNGKIHVPGSSSHIELNKVFEKFITILENLNSSKFICMNIKNHIYYNENFIVGKYNGIICNRIKILKNSYVLIPEEIRLTLEDGFFYSEDHFRKRKIFNNLGEYIGMSEVIMENRKNLPKNGSFYVKNKCLYYNYNSKQFGKIQEPEFSFQKLNENESLKTIIFFEKEKINLNLNISNTNGSFKIISKNKIDKTKLFNLLSKNYTTIYNPNDYPAIKCIFYYNSLSDTFSKNETPSSNLIKVQIYGDRINLTGRTKEIVVAGYSFLKKLLTILDIFNYTMNTFEVKEIDDSFKECTIFDLYELI